MTGDTNYYSYDYYEAMYLSENSYTDESPDERPVFGSARDYWDEVSYGQFRLADNSAIINPPVTVDGQQRIDWLVSSHPKAYFHNHGGAHGLYLEARDTAIARGWLNSVGDYDCYAVVYANKQDGISNLWPVNVNHHHFIVNEKAGGDVGVAVNGYLAGIYHFVHEFGHCLALDDIRGPDGGNADGLGDFSLMGTYVGDWRIWESPPHLSSYEKMLLEWLTPHELTNTARQHALPNVEDNAYALVYNLGGMNPNNWHTGEYFLVENRQATGFDRIYTDPITNNSGGLLIYHHGTAVFPSEERIMLEEADGSHDLNLDYGNTGDLGDFYPGNSGNTRYTDHTTPNARRQDGSFSRFAVASISASQSTMTADFFVNAWGNSVTQDTTWSGDVYLAHDIDVDNNATLTINPGTRVQIASGVSITVQSGAHLIADGTSADPITLTSAKATPSAGDWDGIRVCDGGPSSQTQFDYCEISYATTGLYIDNTDVEITRSYIHHNSVHGVSLVNGGTVDRMQYTSITENGSSGLNLYGNAAAYLGYYRDGANDISANNVGLNCENDSYLFLGIVGNGGGDNSVTQNSAWAATALTGGDIDAEITWWGTASPGSGLFLYSGYGGTIDYQPYLTSEPESGSPLAKSGGSGVFTTTTEPVIKLEDPASLYAAGKYYRWAQNRPRALQLWRQIVARFPTSEYAPRALVRVYHVSAELQDATVGNFLQEVANRKAIPPAVRRKALVLRTLLALQRQEVANAARLVRTLIDEYPDTYAEVYGLYVQATRPLKAGESHSETLRSLKDRYPTHQLTMHARALRGETVDWSQWDEGLAKSPFPGGQTEANLPQEVALYPAYPNPFNPRTTLRYDLPKAADVTIRICDLTGDLVTTLQAGTQPAGYHQVVWDGTDSHGHAVASGVYFCLLTAGQKTQSKKMLLVK